MRWLRYPYQSEYNNTIYKYVPLLNLSEAKAFERFLSHHIPLEEDESDVQITFGETLRRVEHDEKDYSI